jgi:cation transport regulator ChaC
VTPTLLFAYGSLVSHRSLSATLGRPVAAPRPATLRGYRREWNVGSNAESHPERLLTWPDGRPFTGTLAVLGLTADPPATTTGAVYRLDAAHLEALAARERNYALLDVTGAVRVRGSRPAERGAAVVTFAPRERAVERLVDARAVGDAVVRLAYADGVARAFAGLGTGELAAFRATTTPHGLRIAEIVVRVR